MDVNDGDTVSREDARVWRDRALSKDKEIERLTAELKALAEGNIKRWDDSCAMATEIERLRDALTQITYGEGRYNTDQLTHAENTIEDMIGLATRALEGEAWVT